jgi:hypothetical protein
MDALYLAGCCRSGCEDTLYTVPSITPWLVIRGMARTLFQCSRSA